MLFVDFCGTHFWFATLLVQGRREGQINKSLARDPATLPPCGKGDSRRQAAVNSKSLASPFSKKKKTRKNGNFSITGFLYSAFFRCVEQFRRARCQIARVSHTHTNRNLAIRRAVGWHRRARNKSKSVFFHLALEIKKKSSLCNEWIDSCELGLAQLQSLFKHSPRPQLREGK